MFKKLSHILTAFLSAVHMLALFFQDAIIFFFVIILMNPIILI